jgi:hypothetical protein
MSNPKGGVMEVSSADRPVQAQLVRARFNLNPASLKMMARKIRPAVICKDITVEAYLASFWVVNWHLAIDDAERHESR